MKLDRVDALVSYTLNQKEATRQEQTHERRWQIPSSYDGRIRGCWNLCETLIPVTVDSEVELAQSRPELNPEPPSSGLEAGFQHRLTSLTSL